MKRFLAEQGRHLRRLGATTLSTITAFLFMASPVSSAIEPYRGIAYDERVDPSLHKRKSTGVSTRAIAEATTHLLDGLSAPQRQQASFAVDSEQWRVWSNFHRSSGRLGLRLGDLSVTSRADVFELLRQSLSAKGLKLSEDIIKLNHVLGVITGDTRSFNEDEYYLALFGRPSDNEPWGFQFEGHHLVINYFILGDQVVMSPTFWGSEPMYSPPDAALPPRYQGLSVLQVERSGAKDFLASLNPEQAKKVRLRGWQSFISGAGNDNAKVPQEGIRGNELQGSQRQALAALIENFVGNLREGHADIAMDGVRAHLDDTWFVARERDDGRIYYRIFSPVILIEFDEIHGTFTDHQHVHAVVRTPNGNDYGQSLLRQHLEQHPH